MKTLFTSALFSIFLAASAHAEVQFETRTFHSNLKLAADKIVYEYATEDADMGKLGSSFINTAGVGVALITPVDDVVEFGLGLSFARYHPTPVHKVDQTVVNGFTRINLTKTESSRFYFLAGVSRQQLSENFEANGTTDLETRYAPLVNGDIGLGGSMKIGPADLGLEYKYSSSLARGRASLRTTFKNENLRDELTPRKIKLRDITLEAQELALTLGIKL